MKNISRLYESYTKFILPGEFYMIPIKFRISLCFQWDSHKFLSLMKNVSRLYEKMCIVSISWHTFSILTLYKKSYIFRGRTTIKFAAPIVVHVYWHKMSSSFAGVEKAGT